MVYLYRHFDAIGKLLYVGISLNHVARLCQHKKAPWVDRIARVEIEAHSSRAAALDAEAKAIRTETPEFNKKHNGLPKASSTPKAKPDPRDACLEIYPLYDVKQAADALCMSQPTLRKKIEAGEIGAVERYRKMGKWGVIIHWGITGWQMIEYLNSLEVLSPQVQQ